MIISIEIVYFLTQVHTKHFTGLGFIAMIHSLIARQCIEPQINHMPDVKLSSVSWCHLCLSFAWPIVAQLVVSFSSDYIGVLSPFLMVLLLLLITVAPIVCGIFLLEPCLLSFPVLQSYR